MNRQKKRWINSSALLFVVWIMLTVYFVEYVDGALPCPLCMVQRFFMVGMGLVLLAVILHQGRGQIVYGVLMLIFSVAGLLTALRQVWLQHLPPDLQPTTCGVDLFLLLKTLPFSEALLHVFQGSQECTQIAWSFLGLGMAAWSALCFAILVGVSLNQCRRT